MSTFRLGLIGIVSSIILECLLTLGYPHLAGATMLATGFLVGWKHALENAQRAATPEQRETNTIQEKKT